MNTEPIYLSDPRLSAIQVVDNGDQLVSLVSLHSHLFVDDSSHNQSWFEYPLDFRVRAQVAQRLCFAADTLPSGVGFLVKESLRPAALQSKYFYQHVDKIRDQYPQLAEADVIQTASKYVAPPWVAGHPTGGAIDVTLCSLDKTEFDLGCVYDADEQTSNGACFSFATQLPPEVQKNRNILFSSLRAQQFVNYSFEWWHWSYGDCYWAFMMQKTSTLYAPITN